MENTFWHDCWEIQKIGFHKADFNPFIVKHFMSLNLPTGSTVIVPLCGKSLDMIYLAKQGYKVIGIELSKIAVVKFFTENKLKYTEKEIEGHTIFSSNQITVYAGDFFSFPKSELIGKNVSGVYDRAAVVALPPEMRERYYKKMISLYEKEQKILCITFQYDNSLASGPPFSITKEEITKKLEGSFKVKVLEELKAEMDNQRLAKAGCTYNIQTVYELTRR